MQDRLVSRLVLALVAVVAIRGVDAAQTFVIDDDGGPGVDFTTLGAGVAAAPAGATLLVREGPYTEDVVIDGKPLIVTGARGARIGLIGSVTVRNLAPGESVLLRGIDIDTPLTSGVLRLNDNGGVVWVEDCAFTASNSLFSTFANVVEVIDSGAAVFVGSTVRGSCGTVFSTPAGAGMLKRSSSVHLFECAVRGDEGTDNLPGGAGVLLEGGFLFAAESTIDGGPGADARIVFDCVPGSDGGPGLVLSGLDPEAQLLNTPVIGGAGGTSFGSSCPGGNAGSATLVSAGQVTQSSGPAHGFASDSLVSPAEPVRLRFTGDPGECVWYLQAPGTQATYSPSMQGTLVLSPSPVMTLVGTLGPSGSLEVELPPVLGWAPVHPGGCAGETIYLQALFLNPPSTFTLATPASVVVLPNGSKLVREKRGRVAL